MDTLLQFAQCMVLRGARNLESRYDRICSSFLELYVGSSDIVASELTESQWSKLPKVGVCTTYWTCNDDVRFSPVQFIYDCVSFVYN